MKKLLSVFVFIAFCGSLAFAGTRDEDRKVLAEGEVLAADIQNGDNLPKMYTNLVVRYKGEIYICTVAVTHFYCLTSE